MSTKVETTNRTDAGMPAPRRGGTRKRRAPAPTEKAVREAAFAAIDMAAAAALLGVDNVEAVLKRSPRLAAAWDRGRLLRRIDATARQTHYVIEEADKSLDLPRGTLAQLHRTDRIVRDLWDRGRLDLKLSLSRSWVQRAHEGDPKAVAAVEHLFAKPGASEAAPDYERLTPTELERATGISRVQWDRWAKQNDCPRAIDGTYGLARVIDWLRRWERDKVTGGREAAGLNPFQAVKVEKLEIDLAEKRGRLLPRDQVIAGIVMRYQRLARAKGRTGDLAMEVQDQPPQRVEQILGDFIDELCSRQIEDFEELRLPPAAAEAFGQLLVLLDIGGPE